MDSVKNAGDLESPCGQLRHGKGLVGYVLQACVKERNIVRDLAEIVRRTGSRRVDGQEKTSFFDESRC